MDKIKSTLNFARIFFAALNRAFACNSAQLQRVYILKIGAEKTRNNRCHR